MEYNENIDNEILEKDDFIYLTPFYISNTDYFCKIAT
jgi:hypothetical protein